MHRRILLKNAILVNEGRQFLGALLIDNDRIEQILEGRDAQPTIPPQETVDLDGAYILPGVIDEHVHFREPGLTAKADFHTESLAAAAGGVTTILDMPNTLPTTTTPEALEQKQAIAASKCHVNYGFFFGATLDNADALSQLDTRNIAGVKLFMGASTGNMLVDDAEALRRVFANSPTILVTHCEDTPTISANMKAYKEKFGADPDVSYHPLIRSEAACVESTRLAVQLANEYGTRLHVAHLSTAAELEFFAPSGRQITAEACLPHLLFCDEDYKRLGTRIKCNPAVKTRADRDALRAALNDGRIATVATDHAPHQISDKVGGAARAASGMPMVQFSLIAMLELVDSGVISLPRLVELMCHRPASIFSIENRGYLREGYNADLVVVRPETPKTITPNIIRSKCNWSPLEGRTMHWAVEKTYVNGFLLYNKGHMTDEHVPGRAVTYAR